MWERNKQEQRTNVRCSWVGTVPIANSLVVERVETKNPSFCIRARAGQVDAKDRIFFSAESLDAGLVHGQRFSKDRVADVDRTNLRSSAGGKGISALPGGRRITVVRQHGVDQAGRC